MKTHWKKLTNPDYLGAYDFQPNEERTVTIKNVTRKMVVGPDGKKEECTVAELIGSKPMILNNTNCKTITSIYGTPYVEEWNNIKVTLFVARVKAFGEVVDALRVKKEKPEAKLPVFDPSNTRWDGAIKALETKQTTVKLILGSYSVSAENLRTLQDAESRGLQN